MKTPAFIQEVQTRKIPVLFWFFVSLMILRRQPAYIQRVVEGTELDRRVQQQQHQHPLSVVGNVVPGNTTSTRGKAERKAAAAAAADVIPNSPKAALAAQATTTSTVSKKVPEPTADDEDRTVSDAAPEENKTQTTIITKQGRSLLRKKY